MTLPGGASPFSADDAAVAVISGFLDEIGFAPVAARVAGGTVQMFLSQFQDVQERLKHTSSFYRLVFSFLCQGHVVADHYLRAAMPSPVIDALQACRIVGRDRDDNWQTTNCCILSVDGLYVVVSLPVHYPTAGDYTQPVFLGADSLALVEAMPGRCTGLRVLDMCAGGALHAMLAAARGATRVVAVDISAKAVDAARLNVKLNRLDDYVTVRCADLFDGVGPEETFDLIVANPPSLPGPGGYAYPQWGDGGADGTRVLRPLLSGLPRHLSSAGTAFVAVSALGGLSTIHLNEGLLTVMAGRDELAVAAFVHSKTPIGRYEDQLRRMIETLYPDVPAELRAHVVAAWRIDMESAYTSAEYLFGEVLRITHARDEKRISYIPTYPVMRTDPLVSAISGDLTT